jgi:hypothetical protein
VYSDEDDLPDIDLSRLPSGERKWTAFIAEAARLGDRAERHFLEIKSEINPASKGGAAKIAKFILGAANRDTVRAAKYLDGYAVMLLGVAENAISGLPAFEAKDLEDGVRQFLGDPGPQWDFHRVRVSDDRDVIAVSVDPPRDGDPIWMCCKDGPENLNDGDIYIRVEGATRRAKGGELRALQQRRSGIAVATNLAVTTAYAIEPYICDASPLERYLDGEHSRLVKFADRSPKASTRQRTSYPDVGSPSMDFGPGIGSALGSIGSFGTEMEDDPRSREEYLQSISDWQDRVRGEWPDLCDRVVAYKWPGMQISVLSDKYLEDVELDIHLDGPVCAVAKVRDTDELTLAAPPRPRGPRVKKLSWLPTAHIPDIPALTNFARPRVATGNSVDFKNSGSVDVEVRIKELRPGKPHLTDDEFILLLPPGATGPVTGTWTATAKRQHEQYRGEIAIAVAEPVNLTQFFDHLLTRRADKHSETD